MKKLFLIFVFVISSFAFDWSGKVNWAMNYESAKRIAQQTHKLIFVDVALSKCPPCHYLATKVYTVPKVADYINKNFVPVLIIYDQENTPTEVSNYFTGSTPTLMFIKPNGELEARFIGARSPDDFYKLIKSIQDKYKAGK